MSPPVDTPGPAVVHLLASAKYGPSSFAFRHSQATFHPSAVSIAFSAALFGKKVKGCYPICR